VVAVPYFGIPSPAFTALLLGKPDLTIQFNITNTAFMSICTWDYGDGQTGNSCNYIHTHTYAKVGTYVVSLTVSSPWGPENLTSNMMVTVNFRINLPLVIR
jgi:PKD repeat protein